MLNGISAALSGLQATGVKVQNNANNVANANTEGFKKGRVILSEQAPQGVRASVEKVNTPGSYVSEMTNNGTEMIEQSNVELSEEITSMISNKHSYGANLKTLEAIDEMTTSLLDIKA